MSTDLIVFLLIVGALFFIGLGVSLYKAVDDGEETPIGFYVFCAACAGLVLGLTLMVGIKQGYYERDHASPVMGPPAPAEGGE